MAYAFVQQKEADDGTGSNITTISSGAFTTLGAGNLLVAILWYVDDGFGSPRSITLSGAGSPTWNAETPISGNGAYMHAWYAMNIAGGTTTQLTFSVDGAPANYMKYPAIYVAEFSGFKTSSARLAFAGQHQATPGTSTDATTSGLLGTLSTQPAGIIGFSFNENTDATPAAGTSFTGLTAVHDYGSGTFGARAEHRRVTATTSVAATFTAGANSPHKTLGWAFAEATSGTVALSGSAATSGIGTQSPGISVGL